MLPHSYQILLNAHKCTILGFEDRQGPKLFYFSLFLTGLFMLILKNSAQSLCIWS